MKTGCIVAAIVVGTLAGGCASGTTRLNPNPEKSLQGKPAQFAQYAAGVDYPADAPRAEISPIVAEIDYGIDVINLVNLGTEDFQDLDVWVNQQYVVKLANLPVGRQRGVNFHILYDKAGQRAPVKGVWIQSVELLRDGQIYPARLKIAD